MKYIFLTFFFFSYMFAAVIAPLPQSVDYDKEKAQLGKQLFFDPILSKDKTLSCASCHTLPGSGANADKVTKGIDGKIGLVNVPTVLNATFNFVQFWDGRAKDLEDQALQPITNPIEMGAKIENIIARLKEDPMYREIFMHLYGKVDAPSLANALAEFEKALITPNSSVDRYLLGDKDALSPFQKEGYTLFVDRGCVACHNGVNVGGGMYARFGIFSPLRLSQKGRFNVTKDPEDMYYFKVPSLRNVALSAPYFHNGYASTLFHAIDTMAKAQLGQQLSQEEILKIEAFLKGLTGENPQILED